MTFEKNNLATIQEGKSISFKDYYFTSYKILKELFGEHTSSGDGKVSTCWKFKDDNKNVVHLYDWKETNLYERTLVSPEVFREKEIYDWHIAAQSREIANAFKKWLDGEIEKITSTDKDNS